MKDETQRKNGDKPESGFLTNYFRKMGGRMQIMGTAIELAHKARWAVAFIPVVGKPAAMVLEIAGEKLARMFNEAGTALENGETPDLKRMATEIVEDENIKDAVETAVRNRAGNKNAATSVQSLQLAPVRG